MRSISFETPCKNNPDAVQLSTELLWKFRFSYIGLLTMIIQQTRNPLSWKFMAVSCRCMSLWLNEVKLSKFQKSDSHFPNFLVCVTAKVRIYLNPGEESKGDTVAWGDSRGCSPVIMLSADRHAKAWISRFRLCKLKEKSLMESSHSPNPRRH